jgi:Uma2 family endonuclease
MTVHAPFAMSKEAFLAWVGQSEGRYEYAGGRVAMMVRVTLSHALVTSNFIRALTTRLGPEQYDVVAEAFAVDIGSSVRFPDILVQPAQADKNALEAVAPLLIVEVLSPGTLHIDFGDKKREYLGLPTLDTYVVVSPDEPRVWAWRRTEGAFPPEPEIIEGMDSALALPALGIEISFPEIYRGIR